MNELIDSLRTMDLSESCPCEYQSLCKDKKCIVDQAADAIERLTAEVDRKDKAVQGLLFQIENEQSRRELNEIKEHLRRSYNAVHGDYNMECFAFKFRYLDETLRTILDIGRKDNEQQP